MTSINIDSNHECECDNQRTNIDTVRMSLIKGATNKGLSALCVCVSVRFRFFLFIRRPRDTMAEAFTRALPDLRDVLERGNVTLSIRPGRVSLYLISIGIVRIAVDGDHIHITTILVCG